MSKPVLCILGSTATGKSKLAIELALRFNGEIISADSMQLYKGLDIVSNKVSAEEQKLVKHHFLSILQPTEVYTVTDFRRQADRLINEVHNQNKLPIIVGGTYYYIESLLYDKLIQTESDAEDSELTLAQDSQKRIDYTDKDLESVDNFFKHEIRTFSFDNVDPIKLHNLLRQVDEESANRLHPNDRRKVVRALQIYQRTNKKYSDLINQQHRTGGGQAKISGQLRFANSLILNLDVDRSVLHERIDKRVDEMLSRGLLKELTDFYNSFCEIMSKSEYSYLENRKGIFQMIGFKEFDEYFKYKMKNELNGKPIKNEKLINSEEINEKLLKRGLENLRVVTKKYSKTQVDWFRNRFLSNLNKRPTPPIFSFDANDLNKWKECVLEPSIEIVDHVLVKQRSVDELPEHLQKYKAKELKKDENEKQLRYCKYCDKSCVDDVVWQQHLNSKRHKKSKQTWLERENSNKLINKH